MPQMSTGVAQPAGLRGVSQQRLHDRQGDQLGVAEPGLQVDLWPPRRQAGMLLQQVISSHVECGREGVYVVRHTMIMDTLASCLQLNPWHRSSRSNTTDLSWLADRVPGCLVLGR